MGMYNTFGESHEQLKVGECLLRHYTVGEAVDLPSGIYCGYDRAIVINCGIFIADIPMSQLYDKWGGIIILSDVISERNPITQALNKIEKDQS